MIGRFACVDFGHQARQRHADRQKAQAKSLLAQQVQVQTRDLAGQTFESLSGTVRYTIDSTGEQMALCIVGEGVVRQAVNWKEGFVQALADGRIRRFVPGATAPSGGKSSVTDSVRRHIASLRTTLGMRAATTA